VILQDQGRETPTVMSWPALGTTAVLHVIGNRPERARTAAQREIAAMDRAASRFRADSELSAVNRAAGDQIVISKRFHDALCVALDAARITDGAVDPTLGQSLIDLGYDRDFELLEAVDVRSPLEPGGDVAIRMPAWRSVELWEGPPSVRIPAHVRLDLGATAKALTADRAARAASLVTGSSVLLSLGGDIATSGSPPDGGWVVRVTDDHRDLSGDGQIITVASGGLATSSLLTRRWRQAGQPRHHILDPTTGAPTRAYWRTASVAASSCAGANIASTAAIVLGERAPDWLIRLGLPARLIAVDGRTQVLGGWPA
jgi:thiamine biosynthesis lipoprotein